MIAPSVTFPLDATKYPRAQRCRPILFLGVPEPHQQLPRTLVFDVLQHLAQ
jgi:hypothetical protein